MESGAAATAVAAVAKGQLKVTTRANIFARYFAQHSGALVRRSISLSLLHSLPFFPSGLRSVNAPPTMDFPP